MTTIEFWNLLVDSLATLLAAVAILLYVFFWFKDKTISSYDVFDATYMDLLKIAMENPSFRNYDYTKNYEAVFMDDEKIRYELYAFMCWNFCETIFDKQDKVLMKTWEVIIKSESQLHAKWFENFDNKNKFKSSFREYVNKSIFFVEA